MATLRFNKELNTSLELGDVVYFQDDSGNNRVGPVTSIASDRLSVVINDMGRRLPDEGDYVFFVKDKGIESSGIIGYEATVTFTNNSTSMAELFAVSTEVFESSK